MKTIQHMTTLLVFLAASVGAIRAGADAIRADCSQRDGRLKGIHRHFCDLGYTYYANPEKLEPLLREIDASFLRVGVSNVFTGDTLEDAANPEKYDFSVLDKEIGQADAFGLEVLAIVYIAPPSRYPDGPFDGHPKDLNVMKEAIRRAIMHLTQGWADGHHYDIRYWEIANEPDLEVFGPTSWTLEGYCRTYAAAAEAIKSATPPGEPPLKVGGPALANGRSEFGKQFLEYCAAHHIPVDFYSFHAYHDDPAYFADLVSDVDSMVRRYPEFHDTELILDEWNVGLVTNLEEWKKKAPQDPAQAGQFILDFITELISNAKYTEPFTAIHHARTLILLERSPLSKGGHFLLTDDGNVTMGVISCPDSYTPLIPPIPPPETLPRNAQYVPRPSFHTFRAFRMLGETPELVPAKLEGGEVDALVGVCTEKGLTTALIVNWGTDRDMMLELANLPGAKAGTSSGWDRYVFDPTAGKPDDPFRQASSGEVMGSSFSQTMQIPGQSIVVVRVTTR